VNSVLIIWGKVKLWLVLVQSHICMKFVVYTSVFSKTACHTKKTLLFAGRLINFATQVLYELMQ